MLKCEICKDRRATLKHETILRQNNGMAPPDVLIRDVCRPCWNHIRMERAYPHVKFHRKLGGNHGKTWRPKAK